MGRSYQLVTKFGKEVNPPENPDLEATKSRGFLGF